MDQQTGLVIVLVAFLAVALGVLAQKSGKLHFKLWGAEAGLQSDAPENLIAGDRKSVAEGNEQDIQGTTGRNTIRLSNSTAKNNKQQIRP